MRNVNLSLSCVSLSALLSHCGRERQHLLGSSIHTIILKNIHLFRFNNLNDHRNALVVWNSLISMYCKCGQLSDAAKVFDGMTLKDTVSWNSMISGCFVNNETESGFGYLKRLLGSEFFACDHATLTMALSVCDGPELLYASRMMHALAILSGFEQVVPVGNALMTAYFKCDSAASARRVFQGMTDRNVVSWTAMISGLAQSQLCKESLALFQEMRCYVEANSMTYSSSLLACSGLRAISEGKQIHGLVVKHGFCSDLCVESGLMDMYSKCGMMDDAFLIFESCKEPDDVFFTVILVGFAQNGLEERAFELFMNMVEEGIEIDGNVVSAVLGAFGASAPFALGRQIHSLAIKKHLDSNIFVSNGLINMYAKCGELSESGKVFELMDHKNSVSWNSLIAAFARHGHGAKALRLYEEMRSEGIEPTDVTFLSLLHACSHVGSVAKGMEFLDSMLSVHGMDPRIEHYACVVDMLGRAGNLEEAKRFIEGLPMELNALIWQALLGASSIHGNLKMGKYAVQQLLLVEPESPAAYVLLANIYSSEGKWQERARIIKKMKDKAVKKDTGVSSIEVGKKVHSFVVEDMVHPQAEAIYEVLKELNDLIRDQEYESGKKFLFSDLEL